jgi:hypothetical protein
MSRFLISLVCLSTLAMAQNRIVVASDAPGPNPESAGTLIATASMIREDAPRPAAVMLLVVGLSGLTAAGSRGSRREDRRSA